MARREGDARHPRRRGDGTAVGIAKGGAVAADAPKTRAAARKVVGTPSRSSDAVEPADGARGSAGCGGEDSGATCWRRTDSASGLGCGGAIGEGGGSTTWTRSPVGRDTALEEYAEPASDGDGVAASFGSGGTGAAVWALAEGAGAAVDGAPAAGAARRWGSGSVRPPTSDATAAATAEGADCPPDTVAGVSAIIVAEPAGDATGATMGACRGVSTAGGWGRVGGWAAAPV